MDILLTICVLTIIRFELFNKHVKINFSFLELEAGYKLFGFMIIKTEDCLGLYLSLFYHEFNKDIIFKDKK